MRVGWPRTRVGEKGVGSEAKVLVPGEDERVSLRRQIDFTSRAGGSASAGVQGSLPRFANSGQLFVLPRHTRYSLYNAFTGMFSFQGSQKPNVCPSWGDKEGLAHQGGPCTVLRSLQNKTIPVLQINKIRRGKGHAQDYAARLAEALPGLTLPHWASAFPSVNRD